jgi:hypothetical protein
MKALAAALSFALATTILAQTPAPVAAPSRGWAGVRYELKLWGRCIVAWLITIALLIGLIAYIDDAGKTRELESWFGIAFGSTLLWFVFGPLWNLMFLRHKGDRSI